jgi:hypothetical protein
MDNNAKLQCMLKELHGGGDTTYMFLLYPNRGNAKLRPDKKN